MVKRQCWLPSSVSMCSSPGCSSTPACAHGQPQRKGLQVVPAWGQWRRPVCHFIGWPWSAMFARCAAPGRRGPAPFKRPPELAIHVALVGVGRGQQQRGLFRHRPATLCAGAHQRHRCQGHAQRGSGARRTVWRFQLSSACSSTSLSNRPTRWFSAASAGFHELADLASLRARTPARPLALFDELPHQQTEGVVLQTIQRLVCSRMVRIQRCAGAFRSAGLAGQLLVARRTRGPCVLGRLATCPATGPSPRLVVAGADDGLAQRTVGPRHESSTRRKSACRLTDSVYTSRMPSTARSGVSLRCGPPAHHRAVAGPLQRRCKCSVRLCGSGPSAAARLSISALHHREARCGGRSSCARPAGAMK